MSKEKRRVPKLRFPGFTEDWEQRKFNDLFKERREKTIKENEETLLSCAITGIYLNSELFSHFRGSSTIGYLKIKKYDLILSAQNLHLGNANINLFFENGMISPAYKVFELKSIDPYFINAWVKKDATKNFFLKATTEGASQCRKNIEWDVLLNQEIPVPNNLEQIAIGKFINKLDMNITLHQRKLNNLKLKKKALLQKLFPKNGKRYPELRFPGFTDAWEQRKLSDILKVNSGKDYKHLEQGDIPVYGTGGYMLSVNESLSNIDAIGIGRKGTIDKPQYLKAPFWTVDTLFYLTALDKHSILFLYYLMQLMPWKKFDESTGVPSLSKTTIDNINGYVPSNPKEEELISTLFNQLDKSITLHQRKLDHLQLQKKALLQQMFV